MHDQIKLKHLGLFIEEEVDYSEIMHQVFGLKKSGWKRFIHFHRVFKKSYSLYREVSNIEIDKLLRPDHSPILLPPSIEDISFAARMEIESLISRLDKLDVIDAISSIVAAAAFEETKNKRFDAESKLFKEFKLKILNEPAFDMIGLFNWIKRAIISSNISWEQRFALTDSTDPDFTQAGGSQLQRFNVINSIKTICSDFNLN